MKRPKWYNTIDAAEWSTMVGGGMLFSSCTLAINNLSVKKYEIEGDTHRHLITLDFRGYFQTNLISVQST